MLERVHATFWHVLQVIQVNVGDTYPIEYFHFTEMENGEDNQEDQHEEQSPFVPDLGLPSDESVNHGQGGLLIG